MRTAIDVAGIDPDLLFVHHVCPLPEPIAEACRDLNVQTQRVDPFDPRFPHTNKIQQCMTDYGDVDFVVLTDVDIVFAGRAPLEDLGHAVCGKLVDLPNPRIDILRNIFTTAGLPFPEECEAHYWDERGERVTFPTFIGNFNGGMYAIDAAVLSKLGDAWAKWSRWLIERIELVEQWRHHLDQISFCMAVNALGLPQGVLDDAWNFPLHLGADREGREPFLLHHHVNFSEGFHLPPAPVSRADHAVKRVNQYMSNHPASSSHA